jgi:WASH complex subunit CCDC53
MSDAPPLNSESKDTSLGEDGLVDYTRIKGIPPRKTMVLLNHFIASSVSFLNHFHGAADRKLCDVSRNISRLEIKLAILEAKLKSIAGIENIKAPSTTTAPLPSVGPATGTGTPPAASGGTGGVANKDNPKYAKYFKLLSMGMPLEHIKLKAQSDGIDPSVFDNPNGGAGGAAGPAPAGAPAYPAIEDAGTTAAPAGAPALEQAIVEVVSVGDDPMYKKYFKMLRIGVHKGQVKLKMQSDGLDPSILDMDPSSPSPNGGAAAEPLAIEDR